MKSNGLLKKTSKQKIRVNVTSDDKKELKRLAKIMGISLASMIELMVYETIINNDYYLDINHKRKSKKVKIDPKRSVIDFTLTDEVYFFISNSIKKDEAELFSYYQNDFIEYCINKQKERFLGLENAYTNPEYMEKDKKIDVNKYINARAEKFGISTKKITSYYLALYISKMFEMGNMSEKELFLQPSEIDNTYKDRLTRN